MTWNKCTIGDLCDSVSITYRGNAKKVVLINTSDVFDGKILNHDFVANEGLKGQFKKTFAENDILYSEIRPANRRFAFVDFCGTKNYIASTKLMVIRPRTDKVRPRFLYAILTAQTVIDELQHLAETRSGTFPQITFNGEVAPIPVRLPSFEAQDAIVSIIDSIDGKIDENRKINHNLLHQLALTFDQTYVTGRAGTLGELISVIESGSRPRGGAESHGIPSIGAENIEKFGTYDFSKDKYISEQYFASLNRGIVESRDVLLYKDGAYTGKVSMSLDGFPHKKCAVNEHVFILRTLNSRLQFSLYCLMARNDVRNKIYTLASSKAAQPGLNQNELRSVPINIPSESELYKFEQYAEPMMHLIAKNANENKLLANLRDLLLPRIMSGEIDVSKVKI